MIFDKPFTSDVTEPLLKLAARNGEEDLPDAGDFGPLYQTIQGIVEEGSEPFYPAEHLMLLLLAIRRAKGGTRDSLLDFGIEYIFRQTQRGQAALRGCVEDFEQGHVTSDTDDCLWITDNDGELCLDVNIPYGDSRGLAVGFTDSTGEVAILVNCRPVDEGMEAVIITETKDPRLSVKHIDQSRKQKKGGKP